MTLCYAFHVEVCFEGKTCPVCEAIQERDAELIKREDDVAALSARIEELLDERDAYRSELRL